MIRFKCMYCGQRILSPDNGAGKRGKCPKCSHSLVVPDSTKGRPAISFDKEPMPERPASNVPEWSKEPGFDGEEAKEAWSELYKESFGFLIPTYDKLTIFFMAATLALLYFANSEMQNHLKAWMNEDWATLPMTKYSGTETLAFFLIFNFGLLISVILLYRLFTKRNEPDFIDNIMMVLTVLINAIAGIIAGIYVVGSATSFNWLIIFPIWNIINCVLLILMLFFNLIDENCIVESKVTPMRIILSIVSILIIFIFCNYVFKLYWAITYSICIIYTTSFDRGIQRVFPGLVYRGDEKPDSAG